MKGPQNDNALQALSDVAASAASSAPVKLALGGGAVSIVGGLSNSELIALIGAVAALVGSIWQGVLASLRRRDERERHRLEMRVLAAQAEAAEHHKD